MIHEQSEAVAHVLEEQAVLTVQSFRGLYGEIAITNSCSKAVNYSYTEDDKVITGIIHSADREEITVRLNKPYYFFLHRGHEMNGRIISWTRGGEEWDLAHCFVNQTEDIVTITFINHSEDHIEYQYREEGKSTIRKNLRPGEVKELDFALHRPYYYELRRGRDKTGVSKTWTRSDDWVLSNHFL